MMMMPRRCLLGIFASFLLIIGIAPAIVQADITGNTYDFTAIWFTQEYQVDGAVVLDEVFKGDFHVTVHNITSSDRYEYSFAGMNYNRYRFIPYYDEQNDSVAFQDNKVYFNIDTSDADENGIVDDYEFTTYPYFNEHLPGNMFFVNPVWSTHNADWNSAISDAEAQPGVTEVTDSIGGGSFSFKIVVRIEQVHSVYNYMNGTLTITFSAEFDLDGVLSTWSLQQVSSISNENHTITHSLGQSFARGSGAGTLLDPTVNVAVLAVAVAGIGGLVVGVLIGKKY